MIKRTVEHIEINGVSFSLIPIIPFEEWVEARHGHYEKFISLSHRDKEKIFLRWKWGFNDERMNEGLESSEKATLYQFKDRDLTGESEPWRFHIEHKRDFDRICYETKERIGLIFKPNPLMDKVIDAFDAREMKDRDGNSSVMS